MILNLYKRDKLFKFKFNLNLVILFFLSFFLYANANNAHASVIAAGKIKGKNFLSLKSLKNNIMKSFLNSIPSGYKNYVKYMHISNFKLSINNFNKINMQNYFIKYDFYNQGFAGIHTAVIKLINKRNGKLIKLFYAEFDNTIIAPVVISSCPVGKFQILNKKELKIRNINIPDIYEGYNFYLNKTAGREAVIFYNFKFNSPKPIYLFLLYLK